MRKFFIATILLFILYLVLSPLAFSWGFFAHKRINYMAVFTLPPEMVGFYKKHINFIAAHAVDPDKRRYKNKDEAPRHYIDLDHFGESPFDSIPRSWKDAVQKYTEDTLKERGILPWHLQRMLVNLTNAFKENDANKILHLSADLGHYVADAHVPLHTSANHNGQLSNQKGIHAFWESRIPELKADKYDYLVGRAEYIEKTTDVIWKVIQESRSEVDSVLLFEAKLNLEFGADKKYSYETKGKKTIKHYSVDYTLAYDKMLNGMVERRMRSAIWVVGCCWYTAWVNAGQPNLSKLDDKLVIDPILKKQDTISEVIGFQLLKGHEE